MLTGTNRAILWGGRVVATVVAIVVGLFVLADLFVAQWITVSSAAGSAGVSAFASVIQQIGALLISWATILVAFALLLGFANVVSVHWNRIHTRKPGGIYSGVLLVSLLGTLIAGIIGPAASLDTIFNFILQPLESTFFALLALFIATAAFRAFRVKNLETFFFVLFALFVLLGQVPVGIYLWSELPVIRDWILNVPALAGVRGILLGVALGTIATGLRVLIGSDRPYAD